jgi:penicillin-binding protein 1A
MRVLEQDSGVQGSLMAVDNTSGEVFAMVGGRDFNLSQFNRATQAERQTGSSFKPYVYTTAVEKGARPDEIIVDSPVTFSTAVGPYTPHNYDDTFEGPVSLVHAFADSRNIPAVKLAERVGIRKVIETAHRFGLNSTIPPFLPVALGSVEATLAGAGSGLQQLSQRWSAPGAASDPQGDQRRWADAVGESDQCG